MSYNRITDLDDYGTFDENDFGSDYDFED